MTLNSTRQALHGVVWTTGTYALSVIVRFGSNVILSRLLNPQLLGMLLIVNTIRQGIELSSDVGFAQNVINNKKGGEPLFYNTVWVMQMLRGVALGVILFVCAAPLGRLYDLPASAIEISAATLLVTGFASTSIFLLHRNLALARLNLFDLANDVIGAIIVVAAAFISPTIESLLISLLIAQVIRAALSYVITDYKNQFMFSKAIAIEVVTFGRWIFLSSMLAFLCASFDRLYLGKVAPLAIVGVYGLARALADLPTFLAARIGYSVIFPIVSSARHREGEEITERLSPMRYKLLIAIAAAMAFGITISDIAFTFIYDARYHEASWMLTLLLLGGWVSILCSTNEYTLLGFGKPFYNVVGNGLKLAFYLAVLPLAFNVAGLIGAILVIAFSDLTRYTTLAVGQRREHVSFLRQDAAATVIFIALIVVMSAIRYEMGGGTAFDAIPIEKLWTILGSAG